MAILGAGGTVAATWAEVEADGRLHIPSEIVAVISWYKPGCNVVVELGNPGSILIRDYSVTAEIEQQRLALAEEFPGELEGPRRLALSRLIFRIAKIGSRNHRLTLNSDVLLHLEVQKPARVLCLVYSDRIEVVSEQTGLRLLDAARRDIVLR